MVACNLETTIIDCLVICFVATPGLLVSLREIRKHYRIEDFFLMRAEGRFHRHYFNIQNKYGKELGNLYFDRYASAGNELYLWVKVENSVLYDGSFLEMINQLSGLLGLDFHGITSLDLARDFSYDIASRIRSLMRREDLAVIINGKEVRDRNTMLKGIVRSCGMSLAKDGKKGLTIKQAKAAKNKHRGITLDCYDKAAEINNSGKWYIRDFYGNRKRLHRLELRMNCEQIRRAFDSTWLTPSLEYLENQKALDYLFIYALKSVLRFRKGRTVQQWEDLFKMRCQVI